MLHACGGSITQECRHLRLCISQNTRYYMCRRHMAYCIQSYKVISHIGHSNNNNTNNNKYVIYGQAESTRPISGSIMSMCPNTQGCTTHGLHLVGHRHASPCPDGTERCSSNKKKKQLVTCGCYQLGALRLSLQWGMSVRSTLSSSLCPGGSVCTFRRLE